jgi:hypothetical protein
VVVKYGGSALWALMIYWIVSALLPSWPIPRLVVLAGIVATSVEFFKLLHSPGLDAFRVTLPGALLLGRFFSVWDIAVYWLAIAAGGWADRAVRSSADQKGRFGLASRPLSGHPKSGQWRSLQNRPMKKQSGQAIVLPCRADFSKV